MLKGISAGQNSFSEHGDTFPKTEIKKKLIGCFTDNKYAADLNTGQLVLYGERQIALV